MHSIIRNEKGAILPVLILVFILLGMGFTVGYYFLQNRQTTPLPASASNLQITTPLTEPTQTQIQAPTPDFSTLPITGPAPEINSISYSSSGFSPLTLVVNIGSSVTWSNQSGTDLDLASTPHPTHSDYPPLNRGIIPSGDTTTLTFPTSGTYTYHNHLMPQHTGTITVQ